jgi:hypothetical protein
LLCRKQGASAKNLEEDDDDDMVDPTPDMPTTGIRALKPWMRYTKISVLFLVWLVFTVRLN